MKNTLIDVKINNIYLKELKEDDAKALYVIASNKEVMRTLNWGPIKSLAEAKIIINDFYLSRKKEGLPAGYGIWYLDVMIGVIDFHTYNKELNEIEIGYFLDYKFWGNGIMTKCLKKALWVAFTYLECDKVKVGASRMNKASLRVIEKCGFKYEYESICHLNYGDDIALYYSYYRYEYEGGD